MLIAQEAVIYVMFKTVWNVQVQTNHHVLNATKDLPKHQATLVRELAAEFIV